MTANAEPKNTCKTCATEIVLEKHTVAGELIECLSCGQGHEVVDNNGKLELTFAPEVEEDWGE